VSAAGPAALYEVLEGARAIGLLGPGPVAPHVDHAVAFLDLLDDGAGRRSPIVDLGSGGGVPGIVLATLLPDARFLLVDSMVRRTRFLADAVCRLGVDDRVEILTARAEDVGRDTAHRARHDVVVARSFGPPPVVAECAAPMLRRGGSIVVSEPPADEGATGPRSGRWPADRLAQLGLSLDAWRPGPPALVRLRATARCPRTYPRPSGVPGKQPLW
jgi:16S rRNA (guanine527-N7)-methyltransferase